MDRLVDVKYVANGAATVSLQVFCSVRLNANAATCGGYTLNEGTADPSRAWFYVCLDCIKRCSPVS